MSATIKDVARIAGTSISTVSKVINGSPTISLPTVEKVQSAIKSLNYTPNKRAQNLAKKNTNIISFITKAKRDSAFVNPHLFEVMTGAQRTLFQRGYTMSFIGLKNSDLSVIKDLVENKSVDGMLIHASVITQEIAKYLSKINYPHIIIGMPDFPTSASWVDTNNELSGHLVAKHLIGLGREKIAFIAGEKKDLISEHRLQGVKKELTDNLVAINEDYFINTNSSISASYQVTMDLLKMDPRPNAIVCANNTIDLGCIAALNDAKVIIPDEMAVVTFDDYPYAAITNPPTTAINIDVYDLGQQAAKLLLEKIRKPNSSFQTFMTVPLLVIRKSTRKDPS
ncbi:hypothetical protein BK011_09650 [Tenericutes bacterium MZ-XQ]|jgi:DNA-binding LacI/PurR family transcriptional regulator|nr:hypothetical protein BK011_09650 [Tenericutes bacterium MZ-XQ]